MHISGPENRLPGLFTREHRFELPLDYSQPEGRKINVFGREIVAAGRENDKLPWMIYFQGGPGFAGNRPYGKGGWMAKALDRHRIFMLDQRGTGLSTPVSKQTLARFKTAEEQAEWLTHFRADNIVRDSEAIRKILAGPDEKWSALGQSYGGFCIMTYLSLAPAGLKECLIFGGVPSMTRHVDDVYRATHRFCEDKTKAYYERYPQDVEHVAKIVDMVRSAPVKLPSGEILSVRRLQIVGMELGFTRGPEALHYLFEQAIVEGANGPELSYSFLRAMENILSFGSNPIFAILHESIYTQGFSSRWSAERMRKEYPQYDDLSRRPFLFCGEMIGPWMLEEFDQLKPLKAAAEILAAKEDWPALYDTAQLAKNTVPTVCAVYHDDMFVNCEFSLETVKATANMRAWVTNEYEHCGISTSGDRGWNTLWNMLRGES